MNCCVPKCSRPIRCKSRRLCSRHYQKWRVYGDPLAGTEIDRGSVRLRPCSVPKCNRFVRARGMCTMHYERVRRGGEPGEHGRLRAKDGTGYIGDDGYRRVCVNGIYMKEHRAVMEQVLGRKLHRDERVHHRNGNRLDNCPKNLELWMVGHPPGQRVSDLLAYAREIIDRYDKLGLEVVL